MRRSTRIQPTVDVGQEVRAGLFAIAYTCNEWNDVAEAFAATLPSVLNVVGIALGMAVGKDGPDDVALTTGAGVHSDVL